MITLSSQLAPFPGAQVLRFSSCWKIIRKDGKILRFTNHDEKLVLYDEVYYPRGTMNQAASTKSEGFSEASRGMLGVITDDRITHADLVAGLYRDARVIEYLVDWKFPHAGAIETTQYWIAETEFTDSQWQGTVEGVERFLQPSVGDVYGRTCRHQLGDAKCTVNASAFTSGIVEVSEVVNARMVFRLTAAPGDVYVYGTAAWSSGDNTGLSQEIIGITDDEVRLSEPSPYNIQAGDQLVLTQGCDRTTDACHNRFNNILNFGGFPYIPNRDSVGAVPGLVEEESG